MKQLLLDLMREDSKVSMTRLLSALCVLTAMGMVAYAMYKGIDLNTLIGISSTFLGFGLGAKVAQKGFENK